MIPVVLLFAPTGTSTSSTSHPAYPTGILSKQFQTPWQTQHQNWYLFLEPVAPSGGANGNSVCPKETATVADV
jgi:hypothetical protein